MEDFGTLYIVQNTPTIAENALKNYLWHNKEISNTIENFCSHAKEYLVKMWETEESLENVYNFLRRA